jgi:electron transfer flavoprotein beta subunit
MNDAFRLDRASVEGVINPFDEYAIEEALRLKDRLGAEVTLLCMGPASAQEALRRGLAMGADNAVLISDDRLVGSDALATGYVLAQGLRKMQWDLALCGMASTDAGTSLVPGIISAHLGLPYIGWVNADLEFKDGTVVVHRTSEKGYDVVEARLPAIISITKAIGEPRYPTMKGIMQAKKKELVLWSLADLDVDPSRVGATAARTRVLNVSTPPPKPKGVVYKDLSPQEAAQKIVEFLVDKKLI